MKDPNRWLLPIVCFLAGVAITLFLGKKLYQHRLAASDDMGKFSEILEYVDRYYMDTINRDKLFEGAINGMLQTLDPHSVYASAEENRQFMESLEGAFEGIGIEFSIMNDTVMVVATITGGPSEKVGIRAGDRIVSVNGKSIANIGISNEQVFKMLRGKKGTTAALGIRRPGFQETYSYNIVRDQIETHTLDVAYMVDATIGYIKLNQFGENTYQEFATAIASLKQKGMKSLILDLRGNSGGFLGTAIDICDAFLPNKELIVYTEGLHSKSEKIRATATGCFQQGSLVVLIDDFSASASEIVAGAVQDNDRGFIIGRRSFGKGLVQQQFNLNDKSSLRLTVARYHTPSGRCIQRDYANGNENYYDELYQRFTNGEMDSADSIKFDKKLQYKTKKGRTVYGGGGIMPDFFVPLDRDSNIMAFNEMYNTGLLVEFAFNYANAHKEQLRKQYPTATAFVQNMQPSAATVQEFLRFYAQKKGAVSLNTASEKELRVWLKALIGRNLYRAEGFYPVINATDKTVLKAQQVLHQKNPRP